MRCVALILLCLISSGFFIIPEEQMIKIPAGKYTPFFQKNGENLSQPLGKFYMYIYAVTNEEYLRFVKGNPSWCKSRVNHLFADENYLKYWAGDFNVGPDYQKIKNSPVTNISWFAANAYARWMQKRLPTTAEWEYAALGLNQKGKDDLTKTILAWYEKPNPPFIPPVGSTFKNSFGLYDMHGLIWEWVYDFNQPLAEGAGDKALYCSSGALKTTNQKDYASYMRYAFRSSLKGNYCVNNLGFRCCHDVNKTGI